MEKRTQQGKLTNLEIASFCSEMAMILKSGISSLEGVDLLREDAQTKAEKNSPAILPHSVRFSPAHYKKTPTNSQQALQ